MHVTAHRRIVTLAAAALAAVTVLSLPAVAAADSPATTPTSVTVEGTAGVLTFHAVSTAAMVQFQLDSDPALAPVAVSGDGTASASWVSWGYPNGSHTVTAADCSDAVTCGTPSAATPFTLAND
ncbi:MAG: hypothetical protein QOG01_1749, partial [Pseudonocardiales bacterium]|nr:hypothetical protein [Pseudonocardiales bacterium]